MRSKKRKAGASFSFKRFKFKKPKLLNKQYIISATGATAVLMGMILFQNGLCQSSDTAPASMSASGSSAAGSTTALTQTTTTTTTGGGLTLTATPASLGFGTK